MIRRARACLALARSFGSAAQHQAHPPGAGMEGREINSLPAEDRQDLRAGRGSRLALAAELNGVPGPPLPTAEQIARDDERPGHHATKPCAAVAEDHDPAVSRRHNTCA